MRFKIDWACLIVGSKFTVLALFYFVFEGNFPSTSPPGGLYFEGLIFGGAYLRKEICVSKSIGLALKLEVNLPFLLCFTLYLRAIFQVQARGGLIFGGVI